MHGIDMAQPQQPPLGSLTLTIHCRSPVFLSSQLSCRRLPRTWMRLPARTCTTLPGAGVSPNPFTCTHNRARPTRTASCQQYTQRANVPGSPPPPLTCCAACIHAGIHVDGAGGGVQVRQPQPQLCLDLLGRQVVDLRIL